MVGSIIGVGLANQLMNPHRVRRAWIGRRLIKVLKAL